MFFPIGLFELAKTAVHLTIEVPLVYLLTAAGFSVFLVGVLWVLVGSDQKERGR